MNLKIPRMFGWSLLTLVLLLAVWQVAPQQLQVVMYKVVLVTLATVVAYWIDKSLFVRLRDKLDAGMDRDIVSAARVVSRSIVFLAVVLGMTLGV